LAIKAMMPRSWPPDSMTKLPEPRPVPPDEDPPESLEGEIFSLAPNLQMNSEQTRELRAAMEIVREPLAKARTLANYRAGRYPIKWSLDYFSTKIPWGNYYRTVTNLLWFDARLRAQDGDIEASLISVLSILSVAKSFGDEPIELSQVVRMGQSHAASQVLEIVLAQGQGSPKSLANVQRAFEDEASQPLFLFGVRGERAGYHHMMEAVKSGKLKASSVTGFGAIGKLKKWWENVSGELELRRSHAPLIRMMTEIVEIAKLPVEEQRKSYLDSNKDRNVSIVVKLLTQAEDTFAEAFWRNQSRLRCAIVGLAAERYRLAHSQWPDSLSSLVPEFLDRVPLDPYDAKSLRYRRLDDGVVIYSVGPNEVDYGGKLNRQWPPKTGTNIGFQLWDVNRRRQPWHPTPKSKDEEGE
jgi:hypothetical protein